VPDGDKVCPRYRNSWNSEASEQRGFDPSTVRGGPPGPVRDPQSERIDMRIYELRIYSLASRKDLDFYKDVIYPRHLTSGPRYGIRPHGLWTSPDDEEHRLFVLVSMDEGADLAALGKRYMQSPEFLDDVKGIDPPTILGVEVVPLSPTASSPLQ
jgi:hypothetical protein